MWNYFRVAVNNSPGIIPSKIRAGHVTQFGTGLNPKMRNTNLNPRMHIIQPSHSKMKKEMRKCKQKNQRVVVNKRPGIRPSNIRAGRVTQFGTGLIPKMQYKKRAVKQIVALTEPQQTKTYTQKKTGNQMKVSVLRAIHEIQPKSNKQTARNDINCAIAKLVTMRNKLIRRKKL
jgi:hypothetical protein